VQPIKCDEIVSGIRAAAVDVFSTMLGMDLRFEHASFDAGPSRPVDGVICLIGMAGEWTGTGTVSCSAEFACQIASQMLMSEYAQVDAEVLDAVAEIANMVLGNVKTVLEGALGSMGMSIPTAIYGKNFLAKSFGDETWTVVVFECGGQHFEVKMFLKPASAAATAQHRACTPVYLRG
jgi:chemotaxis protein CheX